MGWRRAACVVSRRVGGEALWRAAPHSTGGRERQEAADDLHSRTHATGGANHTVHTRLPIRKSAVHTRPAGTGSSGGGRTWIGKGIGKGRLSLESQSGLIGFALEAEHRAQRCACRVPSAVYRCGGFRLLYTGLPGNTSGARHALRMFSLCGHSRSCHLSREACSVSDTD